MNAHVQLNFYVEFGIHTVCIPINTAFLNTSCRKHPEVKIWILKLHKTHQWRKVRDRDDYIEGSIWRATSNRKDGGEKKMGGGV